MEKIESLFYEMSGPRTLCLKKEILNFNLILPNEIIAKTCYSAISPGTEVAAFCGVESLRGDRITYPRLLGYCNIAQVIFKGDSVSKLEIGDYFLNFQSHRSHFRCNENDFLIKVSENNIKDKCVSYLFHLGYHSLLTANIQAGHNIGVIGLGVLGFTTSIMSKVAGANTFVLTNQLFYKNLLDSKKINILPKDLSSLDSINKKTHQIGIDIVINTSNSWEDWLLALNIVNKGGTIVNLGFPGRGQSPPHFNPLDPKFLYMKNVTIKYLSELNQTGAEIYEQRFNIERNLKYILDLMESNAINSSEIISSEISYLDLEKQYLLYESKKQNLFSTILKWC
ncbi:MAG: hypothetical protein V4547_01300 [Bacteroidota bacterium]